jgi:hypothetical protein
MKNGMASSEKIVMPEVMRWNAITIGKPSCQKTMVAEMPMAKATGMPMATPTPNSPRRSASPMDQASVLMAGDNQ